MQVMLAQLYDAPVEYDVQDFVVSDRGKLSALLGRSAERDRPHQDEITRDEEVLVIQHGDEVRIGVFLDAPLLQRLAERDPLQTLNAKNLEDYCTALEGVSHFHYLMWSLARGRNVSLLELELQAEVDKYASALILLTRQSKGRFPEDLHARVFHRVSFLPQLDAASRQRYEEANHHAAKFCRALDQRYLRRRQSRPEAWLNELRRFFRCGHQEKIRQLAV
jgi:hypothetical protein